MAKTCLHYRQLLFKSFIVIWLGRRESQQKEVVQSMFTWWRDRVEDAHNHELADVVNHFSRLLNVNPLDR